MIEAVPTFPRSRLLGALLACMLLAIPSAGLTQGAPPDLLIFAGYDPQSSDYQQVFGLGTAIQEEHQTAFRILPFGQSIGRFSAGRAGRADFIEEGGGVYFAAEGLEEFAAPDWGPQPISLIFQPPGLVGVGPLTVEGTGIETIGDIGGKRVAWVIGYPASNIAIESYLAFANLTWDDVEIVEFSSYNESVRGLTRNQVDLVFGYGASSIMQEVLGAGETMVYVELPHEDQAAWQRFQAVNPYTEPFETDNAIGIEPGDLHELTTYRHNNMLAYTDQVPEELAYFLIKAIHELYPEYRNAHAELETWVFEEGTPAFGVAPYHPGVVKYLQDQGVWTAEHEAYQSRMTQRQSALVAAWNQAVEESSGDAAALAEIWPEYRRKAIQSVQ